MSFHTASRVLAAVVSLVGFLHAQTYERVDVNALGQPGNDSSHTGGMSRDGRFVTFLSQATNLAGSGTPGVSDVFLRDRLLGTTARITSLSSGAQMATSCGISADGSTIFFTRNVGTPTQNPARAFVYVVATGVTTEIGVGLNNVYVGGLSFDGRFAVVTSQAPPGLTSLVHRIEVATGAMVLVSKDPAGTPVAGFGPCIDDTGTIVSFSSASSAIVPNDTNGMNDVFVHDLGSGTMTRVSVSSSGAEGNGHTHSASLSGDARYVVMVSRATNLALGDTNTSTDVYLRDLQLGTTTLESLNSAQVSLGTNASHGGISADGSSIALFTDTPFVEAPSVFVRDRFVGALIPTAPADTFPYYPAPAGLTGDGREMLLESNQTKLGMPHQDLWGVFVVGLGPRCSTSGYCTSLPNSTGVAATIGAQGDASRSLNTLVISGVGMPNNSFAMVASGTVAIDPGVPFGNGLLCMGGSIVRHGIQVAAGGVILDHQDVNSAEYAGVNPGDTRYYQIVYRDAAAGGANFNTTDAVAVTFCW